MTLEEAKAFLAKIKEAEQLVAEEQAALLRKEREAECQRGWHVWINSPMERYCAYCGKAKTPVR